MCECESREGGLTHVCECVSGGSVQSCSTGVLIFFSEIFSYFCFLFAARSPCHGRLPLLKYMRT